MRGLVLTMMVLGLFAFIGCGTSETTSPEVDPPVVERPPVMNQETDNDDFEGNPTYSPIGQWILFESDSTGNRDIWRIPLGGGSAEQLTNDFGEDTAPSWAPDGTKFVFESDRSGTKDLWIYDFNGEGNGITRLTSDDGDEGSPCWSHDGLSIVFESNRDKVGGSDLWSVPVDDGSSWTQITDTDNGVIVQCAGYSPDDSMIVFELSSTSLYAIYSIPAAGGQMTQLTDSAGYEGHPAYSPDGLEIAYESTITGSSEIYTMAFDGSEQRRVTNAGGHWPQYSYDGLSMVYCVFEGAQPNIWTLTINW